MSKIVTIPGRAEILFPDEMTGEQITAEIEKKFFPLKSYLQGTEGARIEAAVATDRQSLANVIAGRPEFEFPEPSQVPNLADIDPQKIQAYMRSEYMKRLPEAVPLSMEFTFPRVSEDSLKSLLAISPGVFASAPYQYPPTKIQELRAGLLSGMSELVAGVAEFAASPEGVMTGGLGMTGILPKTAHKIIAGYFAWQLSRQNPELAKQISDAYLEGDTAKLTKAGTVAAGTIFGAGYLGGRAVPGRAPPTPLEMTARLLDREIRSPKFNEYLDVLAEQEAARGGLPGGALRELRIDKPIIAELEAAKAPATAEALKQTIPETAKPPVITQEVPSTEAAVSAAAEKKGVGGAEPAAPPTPISEPKPIAEEVKPPPVIEPEIFDPAKLVPTEGPITLGAATTIDIGNLPALYKFTRKYFTAAGMVPEVHALNVRRMGEFRSMTRDVQWLNNDLMKALGEHYGIGAFKRLVGGLKRIPTDTIHNLNRALGNQDFDLNAGIPKDVLEKFYTGGEAASEVEAQVAAQRNANREQARIEIIQAINALPEKVRPIVEQMRTKIDEYSRMLIDLGIVEGPMAELIDANRGIYLTRAYRLFKEKDWQRRIAPDVWNRAIDYEFQAMEDAYHLRELKGEDMSEVPPPTREDAKRKLDQWMFDLKGIGQEGLIKGGKLGAKDLSSLQQRENIPKVLRDLLGEYDTPTANFAITAGKLASMIANHKFLEAVRTIGMNKFLFTDKTSPEGYRIKLAADASSVMSPLNGLRTSKDVIDVFNQYFKNQKEFGLVFRSYMALNSATKQAKTVYSPMTAIRNAISFGQWAFWTANGMLFDPIRFGKAFRDGIKAMSADFGWTTNEQWRKIYREAAKYGLSHENPYLGDIKASIEDIQLRDINPDGVWNADWGRFLKKVFIDLPRGFYSAPDVWGKITGWVYEAEVLRKAYPDMPREERLQKAATIIRNTFPTYSQIPEAWRQWRRAPVFGPFMSFGYEQIRTTFWTARQAAEEIGSGNAALRMRGIQRAAGLMTMMWGMTYGASQISKLLAGVSDEKDKLFRRALAVYEQMSEILHFPTKPGFQTYMNLTFQNPYSLGSEVLNAVLQGIRDDKPYIDIATKALGELLQPFVDPQILSGALMDVGYNAKRGPSGGRLYNPEDKEKIWPAIAMHLWEAFEPGALTRIRHGLIPVLQDREVPGTKKPTFATWLIPEFTGFKVRTIDIGVALEQRAKAFQAQQADVGAIFTGAIQRGAQASDLIAAYTRMAQRRYEKHAELKRDVAMARAYGLTEDRIRDILTAANVSREIARDVMRGTFRMTPPTQDAMQKAKDRGVEFPGPELIEIMRGMPSALPAK